MGFVNLCSRIFLLTFATLLIVECGHGTPASPVSSSTKSLRTMLTNVPYNFTLTAWNTTSHNLNETGTPLVLGQNGATAGASIYVTSTYASYPYNEYPSLSLISGSLRVYLPSGAWTTNATAPWPGSPLQWISSTFYTRPAATGYGVVHIPAYPYPALAVDGREDLWSLCPFEGFKGQTSVVYDVERDRAIPEDWIGFQVGECYPVRIYVIEVR